MVYEYKRVTGCAKGMVAGMAGVLDCARFQLFLAREAGVSIKDVRAMVLGGHGDDMVPVLSMTTINGVPATHADREGQASSRSSSARARAAARSSTLMGTSAYYAPASAAVAMAEAYLLDQKRLLAVRRLPRRRVRLQGPLHGRARASSAARASRRSSRSRSPTKRRACSRRAPRASRASSTS